MASISDAIAGQLAGGPPGADAGPEEAQGDEMGLEAAANDLIKAIHTHDATAVVEALRNAFTILDAEPHEEGEHPEAGEAPPAAQ